MKTSSSILTAGLFSIAFIAPALARDVRLADCPQPVQSAVTSNARDGRVDEVEMVQIQGETVYIAEVDLKGGADLKLHVAPDGKLIRTVEDIRLSTAPEAVRSALKALGGHVDDIDLITAGSTVSYDADVERHGEPDLDVIVSAGGKIIGQAEDRD